MKKMTGLLTSVPVAAMFLAAGGPAHAQPATRGAPTLRTPPAKRADARGDDPPAVQGVTPDKEIEHKPLPGGASVSLNLEDADLPELVKAISQITGKRFIFSSKLRQIKATVYSPSDAKITADEAYNAFLSILASNGMTVIPHGRFLQIVETSGVATHPTPVYGPASPVPNEDRYVTRLYRVAHVDVTEAAQVLAKFKSRDGELSVYAPGNLLILTDTGSNIHRMMRILGEIDVSGAGEQIWVEKLNYAGAAEVANKLDEVLDVKKSGAPGARGGGGVSVTRVVADERENALVIVAAEPDYLRMLELIKVLDVKPSGGGEIHVLPLQHAACKDLAQTLNQILGTAGIAGSAAMGRPGMPPVPGPSAGGVRGAAGPGIEDVFEGRVRITCDEATNAIVTTS